MTHEEISEKVRSARSLSECKAVSELLINYLRQHPDDDDLRDEGSGLYMKMSALQHTFQAGTIKTAVGEQR